MFLTWLRWAILGAAILPSLSYLFIIFAARSFFRRHNAAPRDFTPPVSVLKPVHGLDPEAYENFASFCRQDYPEYEVLFAVTSEQDAATPVIRKLIADFPALPIRLVVTPEKIGSNDKVNKLCGLARAARHNLLVLSDADIRVGPGYLRSIAAPFRDAQVGAVTSMFTGIPVPFSLAGVGGHLPQHRFHARRPDGAATGRSALRAGRDGGGPARVPGRNRRV